MPKKLILLLSIYLITAPIFSQNQEFKKPDYKKIQKTIKKKSSPFYYPELIKRFMTSDSSMSLEEKRHLYYGYTFNKNYSPYGNSNYNDSLRPLLQKEEHNYEELEKIVTLTDSLLEETPFDLRAINYHLYASDKLAKKESFNKRLNQFNVVVDAMLSSGDGLSKKTAYYVINTSHEYDLLTILGFEFGGNQSLIEHFDYLSVAENEAEIEGLYFDVSPCLNHLSDMFK